jgi:hypothetical protein
VGQEAPEGPARALQQLANQYGQQAADLAGFPVEVDLQLTEGDGYIEHTPDPRVEVAEFETSRPFFSPSF